MRALLCALAMLCATPAPTRADVLSPAARARCIQSIARIESDTTRGTISGSGTVIDLRGYVLTNFHVVGRTDPSDGAIGTLYAKRLRVALVRDERGTVRDEFLAEVVRGDVRLDLALLRIVARADGQAIRSAEYAAGFAAMALAPLVPALGTSVWALGFPAGVRTINITAGQISGFESNSAGAVAWMRTDAEFNPGNSGGALVDEQCRLVGIPTAMSHALEPIEIARPGTRVPEEWRNAMRGTAVLAAAPIEGFHELGTLAEFVDTDSGDGYGAFGEMHYYRLPAERPGVVSISPRLEAGVIAPNRPYDGTRVGQVLLTAADGANAILAVLVPRGTDGRSPSVRLRFTPNATSRESPSRETAPPRRGADNSPH